VTQINKKGSSGVSVVEILIGLGMLVVILSFATPSLSSVTAKVELLSAVENMEYSIRVARNTARRLESEVVMQIHNDRRLEKHSVTFFVAGNKSTTRPADMLQTYELPENIRIVTESSNIEFNHQGLVQPAVPLMLVSSQQDAVNHRFLIE
jgi:Tfp pilus assembly protein FimT